MVNLIVTCIEKTRDKNGVIISYLLQDGQGGTKRFLPDELKNAIITGNIRVNNLKLTSDNRLIDIKPEEFKSYDNEVMVSNNTRAEYALLKIIKEAFSLDMRVINFDRSNSGYALTIRIEDGRLNVLAKAKHIGKDLIEVDDRTIGEGNKNLKGTNITELIITNRAQLKRVNNEKSAMMIDYTIETFFRDNTGRLIQDEHTKSLDLLINKRVDVQEMLNYYQNSELVKSGKYNPNLHLSALKKDTLYKYTSEYEPNINKNNVEIEIVALEIMAIICSNFGISYEEKTFKQICNLGNRPSNQMLKNKLRFEKRLKE